MNTRRISASYLQDRNEPTVFMSKLLSNRWRHDGITKVVLLSSAHNASPDVNTFTHGETGFICNKT